MNDTTPEVARLVRELFTRKTGAERFYGTLADKVYGDQAEAVC